VALPSNKNPSNTGPFRLSDYDYHLPEELIAQEPAFERDQSRLMILNGDETRHASFEDVINLFSPGDVLVVNDTKVFPARLLGRKETGGKVELFLLDYPRAIDAKESQGDDSWSLMESHGLFKSSKGARAGMKVVFGEDFEATILDVFQGGKVRVILRFNGDPVSILEKYGRMPLPPYIQRKGEEQEADRNRYQTIYAKKTGAVAAPTAGLHFSPQLLQRIKEKGVDIVHVTLHVGYGTFAPVREDDIRNYQIHAEFVQVSKEAAAKINRVKAAGGMIWPVGTTSVRTLEWATDETGNVQPVEGFCDLYIYPGYSFRLVDRLITNFHLPQSSLLFLVSALIGYDRILSAYEEAVREKYRFFSYGDAMVILPG